MTILKKSHEWAFFIHLVFTYITENKYILSKIPPTLERRPYINTWEADSHLFIPEIDSFSFFTQSFTFTYGDPSLDPLLDTIQHSLPLYDKLRIERRDTNTERRRPTRRY